MSLPAQPASPDSSVAAYPEVRFRELFEQAPASLQTAPTATSTTA